MKTVFRYFTAALLVLLIPAAVIAAEPGYLRMSHVEGDVQIKIPEGTDWGPAVANGPLSEGDQVWVPKGARAEIQLPGGAAVRLDGNSALQILSVGSGAAQFHLSQGGAYVYAETSPRETIQIDTPDASIRATTNAVYRIDLTDRATDVAVYKGFVETENRLGQTRVTAGKMLSLGQETNGSLAPLGPPDAWERWNTARNDSARNIAGVSTRYLPEELKGYSRDFDTGGRWVSVPEYGTVWTPTVIVVEQWAPYRHGRWIWRHGNYIWLPYDSWGWVPYHYGRWTHLPRYGWCWVPPAPRQVYWGPGFVGWVQSSSYIGWVPLAPGEIYYGRGYYGPHSVNIVNVNISQVNVTTVYRNSTVRNGATVTHRDRFHSHTPRGVGYNRTAHNDLFGRKNISVTGPDVKPGNTQHRWSDRRIAPEHRPPQAVQRTSVNDLKQQRPLVREPERSVFRRGEPSRNLPVTNVNTPSTPRRVAEPSHPTDPAFTGKPAGRDGNGDRRRPGDVTPAGRPGTPDSRVQPGNGGPRTQQPESNGTRVPDNRRVHQEERRQIQTPDAGRPGNPAVVQPDPQRRQPQANERREPQREYRPPQPEQRTSEPRPAERTGVGTERRQEQRTEPTAPRREEREIQQQERGRQGGAESQQPGKAPSSERGRSGGRDGSFNPARDRQNVYAAQRAVPVRPEPVREVKGVAPQPRQVQVQAQVRPQQVQKVEHKVEKQQAKEQRHDGKDSRENKGRKNDERRS